MPENTDTPDTIAGPAESAALASELFAPGVGAQAGPPTTPASATGTAGAGPGSHSHGGPAPTGSPAERFTSADPDDFAVVTGREEQWRFTPMKRVRPLLEGADSDARLELTSDLPDGVELTTVGADDPLLQGPARAGRPAGRAHPGPRRAAPPSSGCPPRRSWTAPSRCRCAAPAPTTSCGARSWSRSAPSPRPRSCWTTRVRPGTPAA